MKNATVTKDRIDLELKKLTRTLIDLSDGESIKLTAEYGGTPWGDSSIYIYAVHSSGKVYTLEPQIPSKSLNGMSVNEYVATGRPTMLYHVHQGQILKIMNDVKTLFSNDNPFLVKA